MSNKKESILQVELFAGNPLIKALKIISFLCFLIGFIFSVAVFASSRSGFGYRGFLAYAGISLIFGVLIFELAEIIRWLQKVYERFDLYDKIDK